MTAKADGTVLTGVSETALLTLSSRAGEARRPDGIIDDPMAVLLADGIDYDFGKFGPMGRQDMALRSNAFDGQVRRYLDDHPSATVVALAEGLQTSFYRLDAQAPDQTFGWLTVDLEPIVALRERLLPSSPRISTLAQSALDYSWMDAVDTDSGVFITAEGLLMYLQPEQSRDLVAECARRFPGGRMLFDLPPPWFAGLAQWGLLRPSLRYKVPPMPFSGTASSLAAWAHTLDGVSAVHDVRLPQARGWLLNTALSTVQRLGVLEPVRGALTLLEFA